MDIYLCFDRELNPIIVKTEQQPPVRSQSNSDLINFCNYLLKKCYLIGGHVE